MTQNRNLIIVLIVLLAVIAVSLLSFMFLAINGGLNNFIKISARSKVVVEEEISPSEFNKLKIDLESYEIHISKSSDEKVHIKVNDDSNEYIELKNNGDYLIKEVPHNKFFVFTSFDSYIELSLPENFSNDIEIKSVSGDIKSTYDFTNEFLNIKTTSGDVELQNANNLEIVSTSGDIKLGGVKELKATTVSGDINVSSCQIKNITTTSGDIEIQNATVEGEANIKTVSGDVEIKNLPSTYVEYASVSGDSKINNNDRKSDNVLNVKTTSGDLSLNR